MKQASVESTADAYLELLAARGVDYFFGNGGTDFGPIVDAYAKRQTLEQPVPIPVTVPHEITAVAMAHGYTMVTGKPQVVMVHTVAGTANATGGLINATRSRIPMLFSAGRTPLTEGDLKGSRNGGIHWAQESFDQGSMVREWVKWDYELRAGSDLEGVVDRAFAIASTEPQGPVYLTLPREILAHEIESFEYGEAPRMIASQYTAPPQAIKDAARALAGAKNPVAIVGSLGKDPETFAPFIKLAEALNLPVFTSGPYFSFPVTHPLHQTSPVGAQFENADVVLTIENDVPWTPSSGRTPRADATVIALGSDPLFSDYPVRGHRIDISVAGAPRYSIPALTEALAAERLDAAAIAERGKRWQEAHDKGRAAIKERAQATKDSKPLEKAWVSHCLEQVRDSNTVIVNELGLDVNQFEVSEPGSFYGVSTAGILGWGVGAALGAKLANRDKTVVACIGDGSYMFGVPSAGHWVSRKMNLPVLYIVWNNSQWGAVANATRGVYPNGWSVKTDSFPFSDLSPSLEFEMFCQAAGGYGERVEDPAEIPGAIERAMHAVKVEGRQALLNLVSAPR
jgi:acetolactate synthase I/II/III large subunit